MGKKEGSSEVLEEARSACLKESCDNWSLLRTVFQDLSKMGQTEEASEILGKLKSYVSSGVGVTKPLFTTVLMGILRDVGREQEALQLVAEERQTMLDWATEKIAAPPATLAVRVKVLAKLPPALPAQSFIPFTTTS